MYQWAGSQDDLQLYTACSMCFSQVRSAPSTSPPERIFLFAAEQGEKELILYLDMMSDPPEQELPDRNKIGVASNLSDCRIIGVTEGENPGTCRLHLSVPPPPKVNEKNGVGEAASPTGPSRDALAAQPDQDDEVTIHLSGDVPPCRVVLRRTTCKVSTALWDRDPPKPFLWAYARSAILWAAWRRYEEVVGLKRFTSGRSDSEVLVLRPRLREPHREDSASDGGYLPGVISQSWGSCILVKTGKAEKIRREWNSFETLLVNRLHPFMARSEACLAVRPPDTPRRNMERRSQREPPPTTELPATVIGSFLGGDFLQAEPLQRLVQEPLDSQRCSGVLDKLFGVLAPWYEGSKTAPLDKWSKVFQLDAHGRLQLFGRHDLLKDDDRQAFSGHLSWDVQFIKKAHLVDHLLVGEEETEEGPRASDQRERGKKKASSVTTAKKRDGLLYRLMKMPVRYSLIHGDLHPRNVLADSSDVWLLDFGDTEVAPTLFDFAKLEVYLRLQCLNLGPGAGNFEAGATEFETQLLDHMMQTEGSPGEFRTVAALLGTTADELMNMARCIALIRRHAARYCLGSPDHRDYLAVLYLTLLQTLKYPPDSPQRVQNQRLLMSLFRLLEDLLSALHGMPPYARERVPMDAMRLVSRNWLADPGAPGRVRYLMERPEGQAALEPLAATRGVLQSQHHHLDVFDHTLVVLACLEDLLADPIGGLLDPAALECRVLAALQEQGVRIPPPSRPLKADDLPRIDLPADMLKEMRDCLEGILKDETKTLLKWVALFHDVGKPATRAINLHSKGIRERVQFLRHEFYGSQLAEKYAGYLFGKVEGDEQPTPFERLIVKHHMHHDIVKRYADVGAREALKESLAIHELPEKEFSFLRNRLTTKEYQARTDFPLLILHGFADALACRGPDTDLSMIAVADIDLLMLAAFLRYPIIECRNEHRKAMEAKFTELRKGLGDLLGITGPVLGQVMRPLEQWFMTLTCSGTPEQGILKIPTRNEVEEKAREILRGTA